MKLCPKHQQPYIDGVCRLCEEAPGSYTIENPVIQYTGAWPNAERRVLWRDANGTPTATAREGDWRP